MPEMQVRAPSVSPPFDVTLQERTVHDVDPVMWDMFVLACSGSFLGTWRVVRANRFLSRVRLFEFYRGTSAGQPSKVGQCALAVARGRLRFIDRLHVLPEHDELWEPCIRLVMARCGEGRYEYGSNWNAEHRQVPSSRAGELVVSPLDDVAFLIDCVEFRQWGSFEAYRRGISENIRRDFKKAAAASSTVEIRYGMAALRDVPTLARLRGEVMERNGEPFSFSVDVVRHLLKLACIGRQAFIATVRAEGGRCPSAFFGVEFGDDLYYVAGGTEKNANGYGSYLFLTLIERWFANHPNGTLYLGRQRACVDPSTYTRGNHLYRRKLRATSRPGAEFQVRLSRAAAAAPPGREPSLAIKPHGSGATS